MSTAVLPLNIAALRVNANDKAAVVGAFKGPTALFQNMPYTTDATSASTGDTIERPLTQDTADPLGPGVHLHWELPASFRRGVQSPGGGDVVFPPAPNRWLVIRYLAVYTDDNQYGPVSQKAWIVESDYLYAQLTTGTGGAIRPAVAVPINTDTGQPFMYMGRVVDYESWDPALESTADYLPSKTAPDGTPLSLTSVGFVGPAFASYYPDCASVFGFWDGFSDTPQVWEGITENSPIQFKVSYQVVGWINEPAGDPWQRPLASGRDVAAEATFEYDAYVAQCHQQEVAIARTPASELAAIVSREYGWTLHADAMAYTLNADQTVATLDAPSRTLCAGIVQEIVWNMLGSSTTSFLTSDQASPPQTSATWIAPVTVAVGNTTVEALSALLKAELPNPNNAPTLLNDYEFLLDALQLGLLADLELDGNALLTLEQSCHDRAFSRQAGGYLWMISPRSLDPMSPVDPASAVTLPPELALQLDALNQAQKDYDQGRAVLDAMRKQLFMDWYRWFDMFVTGEGTTVDFNALTSFLYAESGSDPAAVVAFGNEVGIVSYTQDADTGQINGLQTSSANASRAQTVYSQYEATRTKMQAVSPDWELTAVTAPPFWTPTDLVLVMEGKRVAPARRNGTDASTALRLTGELLDTLGFRYGNESFTMSVADLSGLPVIGADTPAQQDMQALVGEAYLLIPMLADYAATGLRAKGGDDNPAVTDYDDLVASLRSAQGGLSPLDGGPGAGLFQDVHDRSTALAANPLVTVTSPLALDVTFTNAAQNGWAPADVAWNAQTGWSEFTATRYDPFLPVFLLWSGQLDPLRKEASGAYAPTNLTDSFEMDADAIDYEYKTSGGKAVDFTTGSPLPYAGSVPLSARATDSLAQQITTYQESYPGDTKADATLQTILDGLVSRNIVVQGLGGFNLQQTLRRYIAQVPVQDLVRAHDHVTAAVLKAIAAGAQAGDNWYDTSFNSQRPISDGEASFGPLRAGFAQITGLEIVDAFGQKLALTTDGGDPAAIKAIVARSLQPASDDQEHQQDISLPPRLLVPTRVWFSWLSAASDDVEMNSHPATSPVFGWVVPDHLDNSLFFYDADGAPVGSFGLEHGALTYTTRPGNPAANPHDLDADIGRPGDPPLVNRHLADVMRHVNGTSAAFLVDLLATIEASDVFIHPASFAQDATLSVLVGRTLALTRAVLGLETAGNVLPVSQANEAPSDSFPADVAANRFTYAARQQSSTASLGTVTFPLRLGDMSDVDDGLVGYFVEGPGPDPYGTFYSPVAPEPGSNGVAKPAPGTVALTLNAAPVMVTMLVDPRAAVHATTGILPVASLEIPSDQYAGTMRSLLLSFLTHPVLMGSQGLVVPLPQEAGYQWSWIAPGGASTPLKANAANEYAVYDYTPQTVLEGWLQLGPDNG